VEPFAAVRAVKQPPVLPARRAQAAARAAAEVAAAAAAAVVVVEAAGAARSAHVKPAKGAGFARGEDHPRHGVELKGVHGRRKRKVRSQVAERGAHDHVLLVGGR
jgi:dihydroxyacetone kinase